MYIENIEWDANNRSHALTRASEVEIDQAIANVHRAPRNKKSGTATHLLHGCTDGGRRLVVAVIYDPDTYTVRPITAWEEGR
ncbi:hypothetical protein DFQ14_103249 [Halopolyspora algeriensis]|uniref:DUF4258 domain-containing protein n=1 Tax=Halopolyspora algeriensis TaxID=1500506 RepID=A0A368VTZ2_9ACTN|nr:hypothetical protein [Halopolyspora algeriensis]RCW45281.1 hypothetical protein DFQ14_103249 [Halopolyspora algeriensis]TQM47321.1 hypothetical protein FHU43_3306 [Halopolyspora algeriensis]